METSTFVTSSLQTLRQSTSVHGYGRCKVGHSSQVWILKRSRVATVPTFLSRAPRMQQGGGGGGAPIDAPSGVLLAVSSVLAIATVGCIFELASGHPQYGVRLTTGLLIISAPSFLFLYIAALKKGQLEAEED